MPLRPREPGPERPAVARLALAQDGGAALGGLPRLVVLLADHDQDLAPHPEAVEDRLELRQEQPEIRAFVVSGDHRGQVDGSGHAVKPTRSAGRGKGERRRALARGRGLDDHAPVNRLRIGDVGLGALLSVFVLAVNVVTVSSQLGFIHKSRQVKESDHWRYLSMARDPGRTKALSREDTYIWRVAVPAMARGLMKAGVNIHVAFWTPHQRLPLRLPARRPGSTSGTSASRRPTG